MSGHIAICDTTLSGRITLRARVEAGGYTAHCFGSADAAARAATTRAADLAILVPRNVAQIPDAVATLNAAAERPVLVLLPDAARDARIPVLEAGAEDVMALHTPDDLLMARLRAAMRRHAACADLRPRADTSRALGFAEDPAPFGSAGHGQIALLSDDDESGAKLTHALRDLTLAQVIRNRIEPAPKRIMPPSPDVLVLDADGHPGPMILRLISELRSDARTRQAMQLVLFGADQAEQAASALDMGADDVVAEPASRAEIAHRAGLLLRRKLQSDRFRDRLHDGLQAAVTDPLTGLHNRRYALSQLETLVSGAEHLAVMLLDLDHFKQVNDSYGHGAGDAVLTALAERLRDNMRPGDMLARLGGEEFLIALPGLPHEAAARTAQRLCDVVEETPFRAGHQEIAMTVSIGIAFTGTMVSPPTDLIARADAALYQAKSQGRNRFCVAAA